MERNENKEKIRRALDLTPISTLHERSDELERRLHQLEQRFASVRTMEYQNRNIIKLLSKKVEFRGERTE